MVADHPKVANGLLIAVLLFWGGEAAGQVAWPNEPAGATVISDWPWNSLTGGCWRDDGGDRAIVSDATAPLSPTNVLRSKRESGAAGGANEYCVLPPNTTELYVGFWWKPNSPLYGWENGGVNKFVHIRPASHGQIYMEFQCDAGTHCPSGPYYALLALGYDTTINNCQLNSGFGDCPGGGNYNFFPNLGTFNVALGEWQQVEIYLKASTTPTSGDGIIRIWRDNVLLFNKSNANFNQDGFTEVGMTSIWDNGIPLTAPDIHYYDHTRISVVNCGAAGCPEPIPDWPNQPTGATPLLDWAFNTVAGSGLTDASGRGTIVSDATAQLSPVNVLRSRLQNGIAPGGVTLQYDLADLSEVFAGAWWKPNTTFQGDSNSLNHMMWFQKSGTPAAVGRVTWFGTSNAAGLSGAIHFHINDVDSSFNNCHLTGWVGNCPGPGRLTPNMSSCTVAATDDQWHRLEVYVRRSSSTTNRTGIVRWWLDGNLCGNYDPQAGTGVNWGPAGFDYWAWNEEWTTTPSTQSADWIHYIDHLYISQPTGATTVDTMPPGPVTNFSVTTGGPPPPDPPPVGVSPGAEWFQFF